jgi:apolipoprotein N-acyltransferase
MPEQVRHDDWEMALVNKQFQVLGPVLRYPALPSLLLGALSAAGFAPFDLWPVTLLCFAAWMWLVHDAPGLKPALLRGWLFGLGQFAVGNNWLQHPFAFQDAMPQWLGYVGVVVASCYLAIYPMLAAGLAWRFASPRSTGDRQSVPGAGYMLVFGAAWIVTEWLRGTMLGGYPWNPLGVIWLSLPRIAGVAAQIGTYALSGVTILVAGSICLLAWRRWKLAAAMVLILGLVAMTHAPTRADRRQFAHVRVVQPNLGEEERPTPFYAENNLRALEALAGRPGANPRLIVWPEGALRYSIEDGYPVQYYEGTAPFAVRQRIAAKLGPHDIVLAGGNGLQFDARGDLKSATNSIFALDARGAILARYDKAHLVPFGEYLPFRPFMTALGLSRLVPGDLDFADGLGPRTIALPGFGDVGMQICYEIIFSGHVTDPAHRPALIFNPSNDSWFGTWGPPQHLAQARLRAIEEGIPIIRATPTGISAVIDADGGLLGTVPLRTAGAIELPLPAAHPPTLFSRLGNWMAVITAALMLFLAVAIRRVAR